MPSGNTNNSHRLDQYSWRAQEERLNELPQYRTAFAIPSSNAEAAPASVRVHFLHHRSAHADAVPLLLIPPFPLSNLTLGDVVDSLVEPPRDQPDAQTFHVVIPSLPGIGFSDAFPNNTPPIPTTAAMFDGLMTRLGYQHYVVSNTGSGAASPAEIDWKLARRLATHHSESCLGTHFISPPLAKPRFKEAPAERVRWSVANLLKRPMLGYQREDFSALARSRPAKSPKSRTAPAPCGLNQLAVQDPNSLAYALCDSPTGVLVFVLKALRLWGTSKVFTPTEILNFTHVAWLPGVEAALRFWAYSGKHAEPEAPKAKSRPYCAVTVFLGDDAGPDDAETRDDAGDDHASGYACPGWARTRYDVVHTQRATGRGGLVAWDRPELIAAGVRGLTAAVRQRDARLVAPSSSSTSADTAPLSATDAHRQPGYPNAAASSEGGEAPDGNSVGGGSGGGGLTAAPVEMASVDGMLSPIPEERRAQPLREKSDETRVASESEDQFLRKKSEELSPPASPAQQAALPK